MALWQVGGGGGGRREVAALSSAGSGSETVTGSSTQCSVRHRPAVAAFKYNNNHQHHHHHTLLSTLSPPGSLPAGVVSPEPASDVIRSIRISSSVNFQLKTFYFKNTKGLKIFFRDS